MLPGPSVQQTVQLRQDAGIRDQGLVQHQEFAGHQAAPVGGEIGLVRVGRLVGLCWRVHNLEGEVVDAVVEELWPEQDQLRAQRQRVVQRGGLELEFKSQTRVKIWRAFVFCTQLNH